MKMMNRFKRQDGVSLLEAMLFLVIAALVLMMALRYFSQASLNSKINSVYDQQMGMVGAMNNYLVQNPAGTDTSITTLIGKGLLGSTMNKNAFAGDNDVTIDSSTGVITATSSNIPDAACNTLVSMVQGNIAGSTADCTTTANTLTSKFGVGNTATK